MSLHVIIGHRGTGKTSFLKRVQHYYLERGLPCEVYDLDAEIEARRHKTVAQIFMEQGEKYFREREVEALNELLVKLRAKAGAHFISLGGGFMGHLPDDVQVIWLRRMSDKAGRIFTNRPRLEEEVSPLQEFLNRYEVREERYRSIYHKQITMAEGWDAPNEIEPVLLGLRPEDLRVAVTLLPEHIASAKRFKTLLQDFVQWGVSFIELRDDLLSEEQIREHLPLLPREKVLISLRRPERSAWLLKQAELYKCDWALELGPPTVANPFILSLHHRLDGESVDEAAERMLQVKAQHYKMAVPIRDFVELWAGHRFYTEDTARRAFLPCGDSRWQWYRLLQKQKMFLNFASLGTGSHPDQPLFFDFIRVPGRSTLFAAVLGDPIAHSHTPAEQHAYFMAKKMPVVAVRMSEEECNSLHLSVLERLGLRAAAVTSPLKVKVAGICAHQDRRATEVGSVNTIVHTQSGWSATNTDMDGLRVVLQAMDMPESVAVWGGGGTRNAMRAILPQAHFFSARRGTEIWTEHPRPIAPQLVIWALGRSRIAGTKPPPREWRPEYVLDLNYTEDSPGLEYAQRIGAKYISGRGMFKAQAQLQREFWSLASNTLDAW